jgi:NAD(P)-dependent dehydrogenase (short-subunit alcohol dehydrogenase family)
LLRLEFLEKAEASGSGGRFFAAECDLGSDDDIKKTFQWIRDHPDLGQVDVCICNAGNSSFPEPRRGDNLI